MSPFLKTGTTLAFFQSDGNLFLNKNIYPSNGHRNGRTTIYQSFCWNLRRDSFISSFYFGELPKNFPHDNCKLIDELFKRYIDDGFLPWHSALDLSVLKDVLNNAHPNIKFTAGPAKFDNFSKTLVINFLDITVLLHRNGYVQTDIFHDKTNCPTIISVTAVII